MFNEENLFACGRDFRLGHSLPMHSAPVCGAAGYDLEFIVARQMALGVTGDWGFIFNRPPSKSLVG